MTKTLFILNIYLFEFFTLFRISDFYYIELTLMTKWTNGRIKKRGSYNVRNYWSVKS